MLRNLLLILLGVVIGAGATLPRLIQDEREYENLSSAYHGLSSAFGDCANAQLSREDPMRGDL